jgi:hypothetical protein
VEVVEALTPISVAVISEDEEAPDPPAKLARSGMTAETPSTAPARVIGTNAMLRVPSAGSVFGTVPHPETLAMRIDLDAYRVEPRGDHAVHDRKSGALFQRLT